MEAATGTCSSLSGGKGIAGVPAVAAAVAAAAAAGGHQVAQGMGEGEVGSVTHFQGLPALDADRFNHQPIYTRWDRRLVQYIFHFAADYGPPHVIQGHLELVHDEHI